MRLWSDSAAGRAPFGGFGRGVPHLEAVENLKEWSRARFALGEDDAIVVTEAAGTLPGFPPQETAVTFWSHGGQRHHFRVFKPVEDIGEEDIPPAWMRASLAASNGIECYCC